MWDVTLSKVEDVKPEIVNKSKFISKYSEDGTSGFSPYEQFFKKFEKC